MNTTDSSVETASGRTVELVFRKQWVAVVLAVIAAPVAMLYVVRPVRALLYLTALILIVPAVVVLAALGIAEPNVLAGAVRFGVSIVAAIDAYRLAQVWRGALLPWYSRSPALAVLTVAGFLSVFSLRTFVVEPFRIPSTSMLPTLQVGDHILVNKSAYRWENPFSYGSLAYFSEPERGHVVVFRYPDNPDVHYIMRVVALPGDNIAYVNKRLSINGSEVPVDAVGSVSVVDPQLYLHNFMKYQETLGRVPYHIYVSASAPTYHPTAVRNFMGREYCRYDMSGFACRVPPNSFFVLGDNRDNSSDSRYWGFVPKENLVGRAFIIWHSVGDTNRIGSEVQ